MIQIAAQIRILVAVEAIDGRKGIDAIAQLCREKSFAIRWPGVLAGDKTLIQGAFPMVAHRHRSGATAASASGAAAAGGRQS
jgi:hypothetical protein